VESHLIDEKRSRGMSDPHDFRFPNLVSDEEAKQLVLRYLWWNPTINSNQGTILLAWADHTRFMAAMLAGIMDGRVAFSCGDDDKIHFHRPPAVDPAAGTPGPAPSTPGPGNFSTQQDIAAAMQMIDEDFRRRVTDAGGRLITFDGAMADSMIVTFPDGRPAPETGPKSSS
jgi:hypothetical protein